MLDTEVHRLPQEILCNKIQFPLGWIVGNWKPFHMFSMAFFGGESALTIPREDKHDKNKYIKSDL